MMEPQDWIPARRRRILLAGFLDFCLLTASFGLLEHFVNKCRRSLRNGNWPFSESRSCYFYS